jgi:hypothetical protein
MRVVRWATAELLILTHFIRADFITSIIGLDEP